MSKTNITNFAIKGLFDSRDVNVPIKNNLLLLVGHNGLGKSTVLSAFYYFLTQQWLKLSDIKFEEISLKINKKTIKLKYVDLKNYQIYSERSLHRRMSPITADRIMEQLSKEEIRAIVTNKEDYIEWRRHSAFRNMPPSFFKEFQSMIRTGLIGGTNDGDNSLKKCAEVLDAEMHLKVIYLPTYRRIEHGLEHLIPELEKNIRDRRQDVSHTRAGKGFEYIDLIEFGMNDINEILHSQQREIEHKARVQFNGLAGQFLHDVLNNKENEFNPSGIVDLEEEEVQDILSRVDETTLSLQDKKRVGSIVEKIRGNGGADKNTIDARVGYFFSKILEVVRNIEREEARLTKFAEICSNYFYDKSVAYNRNTYEIAVIPNSGKGHIPLAALSSGEKQIFSLFAHLFLTSKDPLMILIDEPELSLSIDWQMKFLPDILSFENCEFLGAVTHSPFVFHNNLEDSARDLQDYIQ